MRFLVVDDHEMVREGLCAVLSGLYGTLELVQAGSVAEGRDAIRSRRNFDLAILDMVLPDGTGFELMDELGHCQPEVPMIVVSGDGGYMEEALRRGALGYLPKAADSGELMEAIGSVLAGHVYVPNSLAQAASAPAAIKRKISYMPDPALSALGLSRRQTVVLRLVMQGLSNRDISHHLDLAESTVKIHVRGILKALRVSSRTQAVVAAVRLKVL